MHGEAEEGKGARKRPFRLSYIPVEDSDGVKRDSGGGGGRGGARRSSEPAEVGDEGADKGGLADRLGSADEDARRLAAVDSSVADVGDQVAQDREPRGREHEGSHARCDRGGEDVDGRGTESPHLDDGAGLRTGGCPPAFPVGALGRVEVREERRWGRTSGRSRNERLEFEGRLPGRRADEHAIGRRFPRVPVHALEFEGARPKGDLDRPADAEPLAEPQHDYEAVPAVADGRRSQRRVQGAEPLRNHPSTMATHDCAW